MPHDSAGGFGDSKASRIVVIGDAGGGVGDTDQPIPCVVGGGAGDCGIWNADHVPGLIVARSDPCGARRVVDRCDLVGLVGRARLYQIPRPVAIRILIEGLPVAGGIQSPLLLEGPGGDRRLRAVQRAANLVFQAIQAVVQIQFVVSGEHSVLSPCAVGGSIVAVLDLSQCGAAFLPQTVIDTTKPVESRVDVACIGIIR